MRVVGADQVFAGAGSGACPTVMDDPPSSSRGPHSRLPTRTDIGILFFMTMTDAPLDVAGWRRRIPLLERFVPLNTCSQSPQSDPTRAAADTYLTSWARTGWTGRRGWTEVPWQRAEFAATGQACAGGVAVTTSVCRPRGVASGLDFTGRR